MLGNINKSVIFAKFIVGITGLLLILFIIGHTLGNVLVYVGPDALNAYAQNLRAIPELLWTVRVGLVVVTIVHVWLSLKLAAMNSAANPTKYKVTNHKRASFSSKSMRLLGMTIFFFVLYHLAHYTLGIAHPEHYNVPNEILPDGTSRHDVYAMVVAGFQNPLVSVIYIIAVVTLGFHLSHGVQSMMHTLGFNGNKFSANMKKISNAFAILIVLALGSIPLTILLGLVGGGN